MRELRRRASEPAEPRSTEHTPRRQASTMSAPEQLTHARQNEVSPLTSSSLISVINSHSDWLLFALQNYAFNVSNSDFLTNSLVGNMFDLCKFAFSSTKWN